MFLFQVNTAFFLLLSCALVSGAQPVPQQTLSLPYIAKDIAFTPDGQKLGISISVDTQVWDLQSVKPTFSYRHTPVTEFSSFAFSPDGQLMLLGDRYGDLLLLVDISTTQPLREFRVPPAPQFLGTQPGVGRVAISRNGTQYAAGRNGYVHYYTLNGGAQPVWSFKGAETTAILSFSADDRYLYFGGIEAPNTGLLTVEAATGKVVNVIDDNPLLLAKQENQALFGGQVWQGDTIVKLLLRKRNLLTGAVIKEYEIVEPHFALEFAPAISPDGTKFVYADQEGARIFDLQENGKGVLARTFAPEAFRRPTLVAFSPDGKQLATVTEDEQYRSTVYIWDIKDLFSGIRNAKQY